MKTKLGRTFHFDAAHFIRDARQKKCEDLHGHTYSVEVVIEGPVDKDGMIMDFIDLKQIVHSVIDTLDHKNLNEKFKNPTAENIALWIFGELQKRFSGTRKSKVSGAGKIRLYSIKLWEGEGKWVEIMT